uniref:Uncharacterized protein LOC113799723 n=1 Tax=Dermatophagoides pteronyssinus TaxID=6956 RepID=A0A6P6YKY2_DERPT|nr:uncharacterized protein LOC113799723 [Dermatophagoides pteronyssinus]
MLIKNENNENKKYLLTLLPKKDRLRFILTIIVCGYYISINSIQYSNQIRFIMGDLLITHIEKTDPLLWNHFRKNMAWLFGYTGMFIGYFFYQSFNTKNIKAFQTFILFTIETKDNFSIEKLYEKNPMKYCRSTAKLIEKNLFHFYSIHQRLIIFFEECQKYYSKLFLLSVIGTILSSQIILKTLRFIPDDNYIIILLYYSLAVDYIIILILSFTVSLFNKHLNSIRYDLQQTIYLMNCSSPSFQNKFRMLMYYERLVYPGKLWGFQIGTITVMTTATFLKVYHRDKHYFN